MKLNKFFRWIWRVNALLLLVGGFVILTVIAVALYPSVKDFLRGNPVYHASDMVNVEESAHIDSEWKLGGFRPIPNTNSMMSPVYSKQEYEIGLSSKSASSTRNYFFLNSADKTTRWLVPTNKYLFLDDSEIKENAADNNSKILAISYKLVKSDANGDGRLTQSDKQTFAISDTDGSNFTELVGDIDEFLGNEQQNSNSLLLFYRSNSKNFLAEILISERKLIQTKELPKINE